MCIRDSAEPDQKQYTDIGIYHEFLHLSPGVFPSACYHGCLLYTSKLLSEQVNENVTAIQRYVRLTKLIPALLEQVDNGSLKFVPAADFISHLTEKEQTYLLLVMERDEVSPLSLIHISGLRDRGVSQPLHAGMRHESL